LEKLGRLFDRKPGIINENEYFLSAVLLPLVEKGGRHHVLFEVRSCHLLRQPGEICFPGGKVEECELACPEETAVREAVEELGIKREQVSLLGSLDFLITPPGTLVYAYTGLIRDHERMFPNPNEVKEVFLVPVEYFLKNPPCKSSVEVATRYAEDFPYHMVPSSYKKEWNKRWSFPVYYYLYGERFIWGMTARILQNFVQVYYNLK